MAEFGFTIRDRVDGPSDEMLESYRNFAVANISDTMSRATGTAHILPFHATRRLLGRAFTVRTRPGDNLMVHKAIDLASPGDVIVVDAGGETSNAIIGEIMASLAARRKLGGFVIDGAIRDADSIGANDFPVFARGAAHRGPYKDGPGEINVAICIDGMVVHPGDLIIGDSDGLLAIRPADVASVAEKVRAVQRDEAAILARIAQGTLDRSWVDKTLAAKGIL
jgi:regulator of RNase E activity RraA